MIHDIESAAEYPLRETLDTFLGEAARRAQPPPEELAELRRAAEADPVLASALEFAATVRVDAEAIVRLREDSRA